MALERKGHQLVGACEIDQHARRIYERHFPKVRIYEDATTINPKELPDFDLLCGGFPCQAFSIAGKRLGFEESRGTLFFEIARIAREKRPRYLLLENVTGLLNHDKGRTFTEILSALDEIGYDAEWQVLNSKYFVPQNRERIFIIGHLRSESWKQVFPIGEYDTEVKEVSKIINLGGYSQCNSVYDTSGLFPTLSAGTHGYAAGNIAVVKDHDKLRVTEDRSNCIDSNYWKGYDNHGQRTMIAWSKSTREHGVEERIKINEANTLNTGNGCSNQSTSNYVVDDLKIRMLTPLECERLQGFPDGWTEGLSDTQRYKCLGNAVTVPVVEYILDYIMENRET